MITEKTFIEKWKHTDFITYNEPDIREVFVRPLLYLLGYSKNTINDIITEKSLRLSESYQQLGRKRISIDYMPTIRLRAFWILEAKPGKPKKMAIADMLQAYLYATHPEIQAPYIVLCNGWELKIYYVHNYLNWNEPIFTISNKDCDSKFDELREIIGAEAVLRFQRKNMLQQIHNTFEVEIDEKQLDDFYDAFEKDQRYLRKVIKENVKKIWRVETEKRDEEAKAFVQSLDDKQLLNYLDSYNGSNMGANEYIHRIKTSNPERRAELLRQLSQVYLGRPRAIFRCRYLYILIEVYKLKLEISVSPFMPESVEDILNDVLQSNLNYCEGNDLQQALCFLDRACCRAAAVLVKNSVMDYGIEVTAQKEKSLPKEVRFTQNITPAHEIVPCIFCVADTLWECFCRLRSAEEVNKQIILMNGFIDDIIEKYGIRDYPDDEHDVFNFEMFGDDFDYLSSVTYIIIRRNRAVLQSMSLNTDIIERAMSENYSSLVPRFTTADTYAICEEDKDIFFQRLIKSLMLGYRMYLYAQAYGCSDYSLL